MISIQSPRMQPSRLVGSTHPPRRGESEIRLGFPGFDPLGPCLNLLIFDDSWSLASPRGNDPVALRYREAAHAVRTVAKWSHTGKQRVGVLHFDHPAGFVEPHRLDRPRDVRRILLTLAAPHDVPGASELLPSLRAAVDLAQQHAGKLRTLTVFTDWLLSDIEPDEVFSLLKTFPGPVHAVALNAHPPLDLEMMANVTVTRVSSDDPPGKLAAALAHSLTSPRRGARHAVLTSRQPSTTRREVRR